MPPPQPQRGERGHYPVGVISPLAERTRIVPAPEIIAPEITDYLEAALEQLATIAEDLK
jgi:hypothetical protein